MPPTKKLTRRVPAQPRQAEPAEDAPPFIDEEGQPQDGERPKAVRTVPQGVIKGGWTDGQKQMDSTSSFAQSFKPETNSQVIKFLDNTPYANYRRHWIEIVQDNGQKGQRTFTCPQTFDQPCPLCDAGDRPQAVSAFNIAVIGEDGEPLLKSWDVGVKLFNVLKGYANDNKIGPLTKHFFLVSKTGGKGGTSQTNISPVRAASLREDYDTTPPSPEALDRLQKYDPTIIPRTPTKKLKELAQDLMESQADEGGEDGEDWS